MNGIANLVEFTLEKRNFQMISQIFCQKKYKIFRGKITGVHPFKVLRKPDLAYQVFRENG